MKIVIDTRENLPLDFRKSKNMQGVEYRALKTGDYSIVGYEEEIAIERKGISDLFGSLGKGHKKFKKEMERALGFKYFAILVEGSFTVIQNKEFEGAHYTKMRGDVVIKILYTLKFKYGIDVIFCNGRIEASKIIRSIFTAYLKQQNGKPVRDTQVSKKE
jgi:ERCC4-type nuclease|tara:strand:+ start:15 stop:494 length:480 start_codon:yes stop_codon:yes gene_type:complete